MEKSTDYTKEERREIYERALKIYMDVKLCRYEQINGICEAISHASDTNDDGGGLGVWEVKTLPEFTIVENLRKGIYSDFYYWPKGNREIRIKVLKLMIEETLK